MKTKPKREAILMIIDRTDNTTTVGYKRANLENEEEVKRLSRLIYTAGCLDVTFDIFKTYKRSEK